MTNLSLMTLKENAPEIYQEFEKLAKQYRFQKNTSYIHDLDLDIVFRRVLLEIESCEANGKLDSNIDTIVEKNNVINESFFPQDDDLRRWIYLGVKSRILQSDCHHRLVRGQWPVREALLELGEVLTTQGQINDPKQIFDLSPNQITNQLLQKKIENNNGTY